MIRTIILGVLSSLSLAACMTAPKNSAQDLTAYKTHMPHSILVLPPINDSPDIKAYYGYWSTVNLPVAESGYYVFPMSLVEKTFRENGISNGYDAQSIPPAKLQQIFGADAALYLKINEYGTQYKVLDSQSVVAVEAKLVDLKTATTLWTGTQKMVVSANSGSTNLISMLITAVINQVSSAMKDQAHGVSSVVSHLLFFPVQKGQAQQARQSMGLLYGPRSAYYQQHSELSPLK
jgi:hypothetical protein